MTGLPDLGTILATLGAFLVAALAVVTNFYRKEKKKSDRLQAQADALAEHIARRTAIERADRHEAAQGEQREEQAREEARAGRRDHFESTR